MNIAFITTYDAATPGGVRNHIVALAHAMTKQGHTTWILAPSSQPTIKHTIPNLVNIGHFPSSAKRKLLPPHWRINYRVTKTIQRILEEKNIDLVHIHEPLLPPVCLFALIQTKKPMCATFHTYYEHGQPLYRLFQPLLNHCLKRLNGRIAVSSSAKNYIEQYFPYDYQIIPNGIDIHRFNTPQPIPKMLNDDKINLLFIGHMQFKRKGLRYLLDAYRTLKPRYPQLRLIIAGSQWAGKKRQSLPHDLDDVIDLGMVDEDTLIALYQSTHIFCAPSTGNESFGMVLLEAMAAGAAIVTTTIDGYANVVKHDQNALLVPPRDPSALAQAIQTLLDNPTQRERLIQQGRVSVHPYDWTCIAQQTLAYYGKILS